MKNKPPRDPLAVNCCLFEQHVDPSKEWGKRDRKIYAENLNIQMTSNVILWILILKSDYPFPIQHANHDHKQQNKEWNAWWKFYKKEQHESKQSWSHLSQLLFHVSIFSISRIINQKLSDLVPKMKTISHYPKKKNNATINNFILCVRWS